MLARTRLKLKNAESSISFMQEQHAKTLEDLHREIEKLQKKNARLTFELTMAGGKSTSGKLELEENLISAIARLQSSLSKEQENGDLLQHQVDSLLTRHSEEMAAQDDSIKQLSNELEAKASVLALVTQKLCQARTKLKQEIEVRSVNSSVCVCPHCFVHREMSQNSPSVTTDSKLSPLREIGSPSLTELDTDSSANSTTSEATTPTGGKWPVPTPLISPHPPPPSVARNHSIKKRASTPIRRQSPAPRSNVPADPSCSENTHLSSQWALRPARATKDTGQLSIELQQLLSLKEGVKNVRRRETHPILPPIPSSSHEDQAYLQGNTITSGGMKLETSPSVSTSSPHSHHRRLVLAKSKGLSSAPSTLRVLRYRSRPRQELDEAGGRGMGGGSEEQEEEEEEVEEPSALASEGMLLMVKETDPKGSVGPAQWDTCT